MHSPCLPNTPWWGSSSPRGIGCIRTKRECCSIQCCTGLLYLEWYPGNTIQRGKTCSLQETKEKEKGKGKGKEELEVGMGRRNGKEKSKGKGNLG